jgi:XRE family aerobic/anaerobic benzoate catabolism transcriptional regulator
MTSNASNADGSAAVIARLAARVRDLRKARSMPRRVLSEKSGVSPRYLAQLEAGHGNISIALLHRIAEALDVRLDMLLADGDPVGRDVDRIAQLYGQASDDVQRQVRSVLAPQNPGVLRAHRICLVGLRGAGKSTLGRKAGAALGLPFVELNAQIELETGMPLSEVMALYGQDGYRALEADAVNTVVRQHDRMILAVAGGLVAEPTTYAQVLERFHTIWIRTSPAEYMQRVRAQGDERPMQGNPRAMDQLKSLLAIRTPLYEKAQARVDTSNNTIPTSLNDLMKEIVRHGFLKSPLA